MNPSAWQSAPIEPEKNIRNKIYSSKKKKLLCRGLHSRTQGREEILRRLEKPGRHLQLKVVDEVLTQSPSPHKLNEQAATSAGFRERQIWRGDEGAGEDYSYKGGPEDLSAAGVVMVILWCCCMRSRSCLQEREREREFKEANEFKEPRKRKG